MVYYHNLGLRFEALAKTRAEDAALVYADRTYNFKVLSQSVAQLSHILIAQGLGQGDVVAIAHRKAYLSYALMLAALRLGIPYVVIDIQTPLPRLDKIIKVCAPKLLCIDDVAYMDVASTLSKTHNIPTISLNQSCLPELDEVDVATQRQRMWAVDGSTLAYIMFTSGSTGTPKGVAITHDNLMHFIEWGQETFNISAKDRFAQLSPMYFDNSVFDMFVGLHNGASLCPVPVEIMSKPYDLVTYVDLLKATVWFSVPSLLIYLTVMKALTLKPLATLRLIIFGGEGYPKVELQKLYQRFSPQAQLVNVYGPTECTCICSAHFMSELDFQNLQGLPKLGRLNPNFDFIIRDERGHDSQDGELCLIGPNVAAGYFNDPVRTQESFVTLTDAEKFQKRMYCTGDMVSLRDGDLYFNGRADTQIKHMGYRIELEEIQNVVISMPAISQAAIFYHKAHAAYGKIIGFAAASGDIAAVDVIEFVRQNLPDYMIPARMFLMPELPKNANGKVDRQALKASIAERLSTSDTGSV